MINMFVCRVEQTSVPKLVSKEKDNIWRQRCQYFSPCFSQPSVTFSGSSEESVLSTKMLQLQVPEKYPRQILSS
jgi:hypothetical protein